MKNLYFEEELSSAHGLGASDVEPRVQHKDCINGEQYEDILDVLQAELTRKTNRNDYEEGLLQAINLCIGMIGHPDYYQSAFNTYEEELKRHTTELEVAHV